MKTLRVLPEAEEELAQAAEWYEAKRIGLGVELVAILIVHSTRFRMPRSRTRSGAPIGPTDAKS